MHTVSHTTVINYQINTEHMILIAFVKGKREKIHCRCQINLGKKKWINQFPFFRTYFFRGSCLSHFGTSSTIMSNWVVGPIGLFGLTFFHLLSRFKNGVIINLPIVNCQTNTDSRMFWWCSFDNWFRHKCHDAAARWKIKSAFLTHLFFSHATSFSWHTSRSWTWIVIFMPPNLITNVVTHLQMRNHLLRTTSSQKLLTRICEPTRTILYKMRRICSITSNSIRSFFTSFLVKVSTSKTLSKLFNSVQENQALSPTLFPVLNQVRKLCSRN